MTAIKETDNTEKISGGSNDEQLEGTLLRPGVDASSDYLTALAKFELLAAPISLKIEGGEDLQLGPASAVEFTQSDHQLLASEKQLVLDETSLRLQRLKVHLYTDLLKGLYGEGFSDKEKERVEHLAVLSEKLKDKESVLEAGEQQELISTLNSLVSEDFKLRDNPLLTRSDARLFAKLAEVMCSPSKCTELRRKQIEPLLEQALDLEQRLALANQQTLMGGDSDFADTIYTVTNAYRVLTKVLAAYQEGDAWRSPSIKESGRPQRGTSQESLAFQTDYERWSVTGISDLDETMHEEFFGEKLHKGPLDLRPDGSIPQQPPNSTVFASGMAAFRTVLESVAKDIRTDILASRTQLRGRSFCSFGQGYFEIDSDISRFCESNQIEHWRNPNFNASGAVEFIKNYLPYAVFLMPVTNMYSMETWDVAEIVKGLCEGDWYADAVSRYDRDRHNCCKIKIIVDNTMLGRSASWLKDLPELPNFLEVVSIQSLVKYADDGMELAGGGLVTTIGQNRREMSALRSKSYMVPDSNVCKKMAFSLDGDGTERRLSRFSQNTQLLAELLEDGVAEGDFFDQIVYPGLKSHPGHELAMKQPRGVGGVFSVGLNFAGFKDESYREQYSYPCGRVSETVLPDLFDDTAKQLGDALATLVLQLAEAVDLDLHQGTSYGMNTSRFSIHTRSCEGRFKSEPYLRMAPGCGSTMDVKLLGAVLLRANDVFTEAFRQGNVLELSSAILEGRHRLDIGSLGLSSDLGQS